MRGLIKLLGVVAVFGVDASLRAQDQTQSEAQHPRFYVGIAVGKSNLGPDLSSVGVPETVPVRSVEELEDPMGWKLLAGFWPLRVVAVEIQVVDFGEAEARCPGSPNSCVTRNTHVKTSAEAIVLSAVLFIPDASPLWDVYGKVGTASLEEKHSVHVFDSVTQGCQVQTCRFDIDVDQTNWRTYVGIGARFKLTPKTAFRVEYEEIDRDVGDNTAMLSVGIALEF